MGQINKSVKNFHWLERTYDTRQILTMQQKLNLPEVICKIILERNIPIDQAENYLNPTIKHFMADPMLLKDMPQAAIELCDAVIKQKKIVIFGDYDVDGATSSALLKLFFAEVGLAVETYIPDRIKEGYGPNSNAFKMLKEQGTEIIITVDCGTMAFTALEDAQDYGLKVIVIDHHLGAELLPPAIAIVNPNRSDELSEYKYLAAVGVAFMLAIAVNSNLRAAGWYASRAEPKLMNLLDLVALGTVCDMVPLIGLNRALVVQGLKIIAKRTNIGLAALIDVALVKEAPSCYHLGFVLGPRINAGGRVGESFLGSNLLSASDYDYAYNIAQKLDLYNQQRKLIEAQVIEEAFDQAEKLAASCSVIIVAAQNWHPGVIGIVASRLKERFNKPVAVIAIINDKLGKASCRSVTNIDFGSAIIAAKEAKILIDGGGHAMAAGFSIDPDKIEQLRNFLDLRFQSIMMAQAKNTQRYFDSYVSCNGINLELAKLIEQAGPYGSNAAEPRFMITDAIIYRIDIFAEAHISCLISHQSGIGAKTLKATAFRAINTIMGQSLLSSKGKLINIIGYIKINRWKGKETAEITIEDVII